MAEPSSDSDIQEILSEFKKLFAHAKTCTHPDCHVKAVMLDKTIQ
jgi:hypothetical protein